MTNHSKAQSRQEQASRPRAEATQEREPQQAAGADQAAARRGGSGAAQALQGGAGAVRRGAETFAEAAGQAGEAAEEAALAARETAARAAEGGARLFDDAASELEEIGRRVARAVEETTGEMRRMMVLPQLANGAMREAQQAIGSLVDGVAEANLRIAREIMRLADPSAAFDVQRRLVHEYVEAMMQGSARMVHAARRSAEETLRPMEEQIREACGSRGETRGAGAAWRQQQQHQPPSGQRVAEVMRIGMRMVGPEETVQQAARIMAEENTAVLPVGEEGRLLGIVTGHDLAVRLIAEGRDPARTPVREVMRAKPPCAFADEDAGRAVETMTEEQVPGLPVVSRDDHRFLGVVALADLAAHAASGNGPAAARGGARL
ncbi:hypothetical protein GCM10010964_01420 [Caldovatus sediminis]|uniref:CBS domain-containing protein n=1 Tax=Caldovatus sediminis TaxID=2041189 RepID=A0A8J3EBU7_9PROT|nr:CBS domain-containing protein [Caldovatus sediminis]GGG16841.1 hypothetical protein GCM10010964_01420 [Caldovatus sediminis]